MAVETRGQGREVQNHQKRWKESSPERTRVWTEPNSLNRKVAVVYYLSRNGQLEHPHFMEVPLSSPDGLFLKDVINRLSALRGKGMAAMYSWSSKRSYKNGFVWHDLSESDFIHPAHGQEYVLKGSELHHTDPASYDPKLLETASSRSLRPPPELVARRRNQSWSSIDLHEYKVYKAESPGDSAGKSSAAADASTQTDDRRNRRSPAKAREETAAAAELSGGEISPPPSESSPETLESLMKADGRLAICADEAAAANRTAEGGPGGKAARASTVLMQLLSCGSASFKNCGPTLVKDHGLSLIGPYGGKDRLTRGGGNPAGVKLEDKVYFSGSMVEEDTNKDDASSLQRSTSCNADRSSRLDLTEEELGVRTKCIPRKPKGMPAKKESNIFASCDNNQGTTT